MCAVGTANTNPMIRFTMSNTAAMSRHQTISPPCLLCDLTLAIVNSSVVRTEMPTKPPTPFIIELNELLYRYGHYMERATVILPGYDIRIRPLPEEEKDNEETQ